MKKITRILPLLFCGITLTGCNANDIKDAGINTIIGMSTVFIVLILISFIINLFKYISVLIAFFENRKNKKTENTEKVMDAPQDEVTEENEIDDTELVAVISAAIAAMEGTTTDSFVVRTIRKSKNWHKA